MEEQELRQTENQAEPELLYHYTNEKGLYGILESDTIWATHYRFLNDTAERILGIDFLQSVIENVDRDFNMVPTDHTQAEKKTLNNFFEVVDVYVVSFSQDSSKSKSYNAGNAGDRLSQWRGYAAQGYCLAFQLNSIREIANSLSTTLSLAGFFERCIYSKNEFIEAARECRRRYMQKVIALKEEFFKTNPCAADYKPSSDAKYMKEFRQYCTEMIRLCSMYKHQAFCEEDEVRVIVAFVRNLSDGTQIKFRESQQFGRTPYIEIPLGLKRKNSPLKRIVVGPAPDKEQSVARLKIDLEKLGIHGVEVVPSQIPYRNW